MPIIQVGNGYIYKKNVKKTKKNKIFVTFVFVMVLSVAIVGGYLLTTNLNIFSFFKLNKYMIYNSKTYYFLSLERADSYSSVNMNISEVQNQGGAGFVYSKDNNLYVIASAYNSKADIEKVVSNNIDFDCEIVEVKFDRLIVSAEFTNEQIKTLKYSLEIVDRFFETMNDIVVSFDKKEILAVEAKNKMQLFKEKCQIDKENLSKQFKNNSSAVVTYVNIYLSEVISNLSALVLSQNLSCDIKYTIVNSLVSFEKLQKDIRK